jgi:hypothetical protein
MTIEIHGHIESLSVGPMTQIAVTIRIASARSQELLTVFASKEELAQLYYPGKPITLRITPNP